MSWHQVDTMTLRYEFVMLAQEESCNFSNLCKRFGISRKTGYKWICRYLESGYEALTDRSRRPLTCPLKTDETMEAAIVSLRAQHQSWGGRKLQARLKNLGYQDLPCPSTITAILHRHDLIDPIKSLKHKAFCRFEHEHPNDLWQIDFKGDVPMQSGRCHPLTALDDHSRYNVLLRACPDQTTETVRNALIDTFRRYGLPNRMTMDNGSPWGNDEFNNLTVLTVWLIRIGVVVSHSRPYHPQTQGKDERFHRTLKRDAITGFVFRDLCDCQHKFDEFRDIYNMVRPHESLGQQPPITRYQPSQRQYPEALPAIEYDEEDEVRKVQARGEFWFLGKVFTVSKALKGQPIAIRPTDVDGTYSVHFCGQHLKNITLS